MVLTAADFEFRGPRVPKLLHHEPQAAIADFGVQNPPDGIPFRRPQVKQAFVVFAGDRVLRIGKVEDRPSSRTTAWRDPPRNSCSVRLRDSGVIGRFFQPCHEPSVMFEHPRNLLASW